MRRLFKRSTNLHVIDRLHGEIMAAARQPALYLRFGVPDTFEARFELFALHAALVVRQLGRLPHPGPEMAQDLTDGIFRHVDAMLREMSVGDITVPKRIKAIAEAFLGRAMAYDEALARPGDAALAAALGRNVLSGQGDVGLLARYARALAEGLELAPLSAFVSGPLRFPDAATVR